MSSLLTCWGIDTPEYKSNISAYPDLPEKLKMLLDEEKKGLYDALIQKFKGPDFKELSDKFKADGDLEKTLQNALEKMGKYLNASNKMKKFELKAIKANMKYKNNSDDIQNFEEYKNVSQKLFHEIVSIESTLFRFLEYLVDLEGEVLYQTVQYEKGLSKEKRRETNLDYYKEEADYYGKL
ncbi:hypothetical protein KSF78_0004575 [Schistosoma japonicum]|nr:hypothetical protein KSF78_0004575 [Schistosoma japonicum]